MRLYRKVRYCSETTLTGESRFHISTPLGIEPGSLMTGNKWVDHWTSRTVYECSEIAGSPQGSPQQPTMWLWSRKEDLQRTWNGDRRAVWDQERGRTRQTGGSPRKCHPTILWGCVLCNHMLHELRSPYMYELQRSGFSKTAVLMLFQMNHGINKEMFVSNGID